LTVDGIVSAAFDGRVVADDHHLAGPDTRPMPGDDARTRNLAVVHVARRQLADLEERRAGVQQSLDAISWQ
jgi:hypothetical protein